MFLIILGRLRFHVMFVALCLWWVANWCARVLACLGTQTPPLQPEPEPELPPQLGLDFEVQEWDDQCVFDMLAEYEELSNQVTLDFNEVINHGGESDELQQQHNPLPVHEEEMPQQLKDEELQQRHNPDHEEELQPQHHNQQLPAESPPVQEMVNQAEEAGAAPSRYRQGRWSLEEHRLFLVGNRDQPGQWAHIAANYVKTRSMQQVASHAQKYFIHLDQQQQKPPQRVPKRKRNSIFDTTLDDDNDDNHHQQQQQPPHHDVPPQPHLDQHQQQQPQQPLLHHVPPRFLNLQQNIVSSPSIDTIIFHHPQSQPQLTQSLAPPRFQFQRPQQPLPPPQFQFQRPQHPLLPQSLPPSSSPFGFQPRQPLPPFQLPQQPLLLPLPESLPPLLSPFEFDGFDLRQPLR